LTYTGTVFWVGAGTALFGCSGAAKIAAAAQHGYSGFVRILVISGFLGYVEEEKNGFR
jgi:hypothetical protein